MRSTVPLFLALTWMGGLAWNVTSAAAEISLPEPQAKAAFLFSFPKYVEWPAEAFATENSPIEICVIGDEEIADALTRIARGKAIGGRSVLVHRNEPGRQEAGAGAESCHLLFIAESEKGEASRWLRRVKGRPALTVGDFESFLDSGGMIRLSTKGTRLQFDVNLRPAEESKLALNAKLLALAQSVRGKGRDGE